MAGIVLYTQHYNPFSEKVATVLRLKGLGYERVASDQPEDIRRWSPVTHKLPVLEIGSERVHDSDRIIQWVDGLFPEPPLRAGDPRSAEAQERLAAWADSSLLFYWDRWRQARFPRPGDEQPLAAGLLDGLRGKLERSLGLAPARMSRAEARELEVVGEIVQRLDDLVTFLGERPYFHGELPSIADVSVYGMLRVLADGPIPLPTDAIASRAPLAAYVERLEAALRDAPPRTATPEPPLLA